MNHSLQIFLLIVAIHTFAFSMAWAIARGWTSGKLPTTININWNVPKKETDRETTT